MFLLGPSKTIRDGSTLRALSFGAVSLWSWRGDLDSLDGRDQWKTWPKKHGDPWGYTCMGYISWICWNMSWLRWFFYDIYGDIWDIWDINGSTGIFSMGYSWNNQLKIKCGFENDKYILPGKISLQSIDKQKNSWLIWTHCISSMRVPIWVIQHLTLCTCGAISEYHRFNIDYFNIRYY